MICGQGEEKLEGGSWRLAGLTIFLKIGGFG